MKNKIYEEIVDVKSFYEKIFNECHTVDEVIDLLNGLIYRGGKVLPHAAHVALVTVLVVGSFRDYGRDGVAFNLPATADCCRMYKVIEKALKKRKPITIAFYGSVMLDNVCYWPKIDGDGLLVDQDGGIHEWRIA